MESASHRTEAEEEKVPMDNSGAGGARPDKMDWDREVRGGDEGEAKYNDLPCRFLFFLFYCWSCLFVCFLI